MNGACTPTGGDSARATRGQRRTRERHDLLRGDGVLRGWRATPRTDAKGRARRQTPQLWRQTTTQHSPATWHSPLLVSLSVSVHLSLPHSRMRVPGAR
jgi:hypothetical protein